MRQRIRPFSPALRAHHPTRAHLPPGEAPSRDARHRLLLVRPLNVEPRRGRTDLFSSHSATTSSASRLKRCQSEPVTASRPSSRTPSTPGDVDSHDKVRAAWSASGPHSAGSISTASRRASWPRPTPSSNTRFAPPAQPPAPTAGQQLVRRQVECRLPRDADLSLSPRSSSPVFHKCGLAPFSDLPFVV
jgi:hypothetical protein